MHWIFGVLVTFPNQRAGVKLSLYLTKHHAMKIYGVNQRPGSTELMIEDDIIIFPFLIYISFTGYLCPLFIS
jgi:hypothetical protein